MKVSEEKLWLHFLSRWMFVLPLPILLLFLSIGILLSSSGNAPIELAYMIAASKVPLGLRLLGLALNLLWGSVAIFFIALARLYRIEYPIKSTFLGAIGVGFIIPMSAGNLQWTVAMDMANRYIHASAEQKEIIEQIQMTVFQIVESRIDVADLFWGLGLILFFLMARKTIPMFIHVLYLISAAIMLLAYLSLVFGFIFPFATIPVFWLVTLIAHISLGIVFLKKRKATTSIEIANSEKM
ncbi:hypothetical protein [Lederbergia citri]|uniref:DUF4386 family protein n=1 Tax=Lederbergia citri TaxID=2833580 RepID=A0A942TEY9_9BACI|nr:hypothetical protein [Lederbergia citri]MBS4196463.1 hypothetical protein [Lederbergia citri]